ncbi:MAG: hypothetical protein MUF49_22060 [Oculatellaceae cyanobacterium Prado106]|jgi:hypothetical protein|nr:hypothetical protein [Oculatellaceae cyanobacterium Prado106]
MAFNPAVMKAVETLGYRVTIGDVASQAGLDVKVAERDLLVLASEAGGHMQVAESGEIAYLFAQNFRDVLRNKSFQLRVQEWWNRIWKILFYLIRISFGIVLIGSIILMAIAIIILMIAINSSRGDDNDSGGDFGDGGGIFMPNFWIGPDWYWIFLPDYGDRHPANRHRKRDNEMSFLESIYSFIFGDGNPNADLEERRWQTIATVIRNNGGAIVAEQIVPYLDELGDRTKQEFEDYMLPVLSRFNGRPEVSPEGQIVYHFPELQVMAQQSRPQAVGAYLKEALWRFSQASSGQITLAAGLGGVYIVLAIVLGSLLRGGLAAQIGGLVGFVGGIYGFLLAYGIGFLAIPLIRYFWIQWRNQKIESRNDQRMIRAQTLNQMSETVQQKLAFAQQFATETLVSEDDLAYTTETDLTTQELLNADKVDAEWQKRLEQSSGSSSP